MQFAGQRTDMDLNSLEQPDNILIKLTPDILPQPHAVLLHGITPQRTLSEGITEAEFAKYFTSQVSTPDTIIVGFNNIRFDNEFIRFTLWRNFHDAYEWSWKEGCTVWDLLDVVRMTRALRPDGVEWPFGPDGKPSNKLEYLSAVNKLDHTEAHDAASDVKASIGLARLLKQKQPELFDYLLNIRQKSRVMPLATAGDPLIYTSGRYPPEFQKTTIAVMVTEKPDKSGALMYDLRIDPDEFKDIPTSELIKRWKAWGDDAPYFPVKELKYNRSPAIAPIDMLDDLAARRLGLRREIIDNHLKKLRGIKDFGDKLLEALDGLWPKQQPRLMIDELEVDGLLYDGFVADQDKPKMSVVRAATAVEVSKLQLKFTDGRLESLWPLYKARNFPDTLNGDERRVWEDFRRRKLAGEGDPRSQYFKQLDELAATPGLPIEKKNLLEDLRSYGESITRAI